MLENQAGKYVYKIDEQGLPQLVYIKTREQHGDNWVISEGVQAGDRIITDGLQKVTPGKPVTIVSQEEMDKLKKNEPMAADNQKGKK